jgi:peptide/nickel transport system ATP-binding protein
MTTLRGIPGTVPQLINPPQGCRFATRCPEAQQNCRQRVPRLPEGVHTADCRLFDEPRSPEYGSGKQVSHA